MINPTPTEASWVERYGIFLAIVGMMLGWGMWLFSINFFAQRLAWYLAPLLKACP